MHPVVLQSITVLSVVVLLCLCSSATAAPTFYPYTAYSAVGFTRFSSSGHSPYYYEYSYPSSVQQPLGYHSNAYYYYPTHQNLVAWTPAQTQVIGHSKPNDGKIVGDDTVTIVGPAVQQQQKTENGGPVVIENPTQGQAVQQPSYQLQVPFATFDQYLPPPSYGFDTHFPAPVVGWIQNSDQQQPSTELQAPQREEKANDDEIDDTISIEGPQADDQSVKDFESKISESDPEENEMKDEQPDAPQVDDLSPDDEIVVAPEEKPEDSEPGDGIEDAEAPAADDEAGKSAELEDE